MTNIIWLKIEQVISDLDFFDIMNSYGVFIWGAIRVKDMSPKIVFLVNYLSIPVTRAWHPTTVCFSPSSKVSVSCRVTLQDQSSVNGKTVPTNTKSFLLTQSRLCTCHVVLMTVMTWNRSMLISHSWFVALRELAATYIIVSRFLAKFITVISVTRRFAWLTTTNAIYLP